MRKYIDELTNNLIGKHGFRGIFEKFGTNSSRFIELVKNTLEFDDVKDMRPETLGKIMCSFEIGDVVSGHPGREVTFAGDCEGMLREMVAFCLAYAIDQKLDKQARVAQGKMADRIFGLLPSRKCSP